MPIALYALALTAFAIGTTEFIISGILPALSADLAVDIPTAGLLVTGYALGVAIGGPIIAVLVARFHRKPLIVALTAMFALGQALCALAPSYEWLMAARLVSAAAHGVFFGVGSVAAAGLVPPARRGAALSLFVGGITVANVLGLPGGTAIGNAFGWRTSFWCIAAMAALAALLIAWLLPAAEEAHEDRPKLGAQFREVARQQVWSSYLIIILVMTGTLAFSVYQVPTMLEITRLDPSLVPAYLFAGGAGSVLGIFIGGRLADWKLMPAILGILCVQIVVAIGLFFAVRDPLLIGVALVLSSGASFAFSTPIQVRILNAARAAPNMASTFVSSAYNTGIAAGAFLGAMLLSSGMSYALLPGVVAITSALALVVALISSSAERRAAQPSAALTLADALPKSIRPG
jgi:DHA1 family inner membrane transport protein